MKKDSRTIEVCCYIVCLGAFGIFFRWMQLMIAYNEDSLVDKSFFNVAVIGILVFSAFCYIRFLKQYQDKNLYIPDDFCTALKNDNKLYNISRWSISGLMVLGALVLLMQCEVDKNAGFLKAVGYSGILTGLSFGMLLTSANRPAVLNRDFVSFLSFVPIAFLAIWLVAVYKENSINPVAWDYAVELFAVIVSMIAFFRIAGFAFGYAKPQRALFFCMLGASSCIMNLADSRFIGEQIMFGALALMQMMYVFLMLENMLKAKPEEKDISF